MIKNMCMAGMLLLSGSAFANACSLPAVQGINLGDTVEQVRAVYPNAVVEVDDEGEKFLVDDGEYQLTLKDKNIAFSTVLLKNNTVDAISLSYGNKFEGYSLERWQQKIITLYKLPNKGWEPSEDGQVSILDCDYEFVYIEPHAEELGAYVLFSRYDDDSNTTDSKE